MRACRGFRLRLGRGESSRRTRTRTVVVVGVVVEEMGRVRVVVVAAVVGGAVVGEEAVLGGVALSIGMLFIQG